MKWLTDAVIAKLLAYCCFFRRGLTISILPCYELEIYFGRYLANVSFLKKGKLAMSALISSPDAQVVKQQLLSCVGVRTRLGP